MAGGAGLLAAGLAGAGATHALAASADEATRPIGPNAALRVLMAGNRRWVRGTARHPRQSPKWRRFLANHQNPWWTRSGPPTAWQSRSQATCSTTWSGLRSG